MRADTHDGPEQMLHVRGLIHCCSSHVRRSWNSVLQRTAGPYIMAHLGRADPRRKCQLTGGFCCKTILGARAGNIDSRTATKAQHRFNKSFAPIRLLRVSRLLPSFATESAHAGKMNRSRKCLLLRGVKRTRFNASSLTRSRPWQKQEL